MTGFANMQRGVQAGILTLSALLVGGCGESGGGPVGIEVYFDPDAPSDGAERVEVYLLEDCADVTLGIRPGAWIASTFTLRDAGMGPLGGTIDQGSDYGLYAFAQDGDCAVVAASCTAVTIDGDRPLAITLDAFPEGAPCDINEERCVAETGLCEPTGNILCFAEPDRVGCLVDDAPGLCRDEECCTGCWDGTQCQPGTRTHQCGSGGATCQFVPGCPQD